MTNKRPVERIFIDDERVKPQTIAHHKARYQFACDLQPAKGRALDLASGTGYGTEMLRKAGYDITGLEVDPESVEHAKKTYPICNFIQADLTAMSLHSDHLKLVTMFEAIEHFPFKQGVQILENIERWLDWDGIFIMSTPKDINDKYNRTHKSEWPYHLVKNELGSIFSDVRIYGQDWETGKIDEEEVRDNNFYIAVCRR